MELNDFIGKFGEQFDDTDISTFTPETNFKELDEWSSLIALSIIAMADEEYDVHLKGSDIVESQTINDLFQIITSKASPSNV